MPRIGIAAATACVAMAVISVGASQLPIEPLHDSGQGVTAAYEGWFRNADGSFSLLIGYYNRNSKETLDIPVGPDNRVEPGGPDHGQPTHFLPRRQWGVFAIRVPADLGARTLTWTLTAHGKTSAIPMGLTRAYEVNPFKDGAQGNTPPTLRFEVGGGAVQGPPRGVARALVAKVGDALPLAVWVTDDAIQPPERRPTDTPASITWSKYRGPGTVTFANLRPPIEKGTGMASTTARFSEPGEYVLRALANDASSEVGGGFQCCWTTAHVKVTVGGP
jgi:hypothetical protein